MKMYLRCWLIGFISYGVFQALPIYAQANADDLIGLWEGKRIAGPEIQGSLLVTRQGDSWSADVSGYKLNVVSEGTQLRFKIPGERGSFAGNYDADKNQIKGHWTQPGIINNGMPHASPVILKAVGDQQWRGKIVPLKDEFSLFLPVVKRADETSGTFLRNPDRGFGAFYNLDRLELDGDTVRWVGQFFRSSDEQVLAEASYQPGRMAVNIRGYLYDMRLLSDDSHSHFYARGKNPEPYRYSPPPSVGDGWAVGTLNNAGIDISAIARFIDEVILKPADSIDDPYIHGFLLARSGKLVLEEYFHGFQREKPHDTRSASKSLATVLAGAAIQAGMPVAESSSVYQTMGIDLSNDSDARRQQMTLAHLMSMSSGFECDDGSSSSRGNEDTMQSQERQPDWYQYVLNLDMVYEPGEKAVYCSGGMNLVGGVLQAATGRGLADLFQELIAEPLQIDHYYLNLSPTGDPYMGGGIYWRPRDFMKLGQLMLNGGTWNDQRVLSKAYAEKSISSLYQMRDKGYGYGWWSIDYPYKDGQVTAFFAAGNGGQIVMGIPALDLLIAFYAGNYSHPTLFKIQEAFVPEYILPAVK